MCKWWRTIRQNHTFSSNNVARWMAMKLTQQSFEVSSSSSANLMQMISEEGNYVKIDTRKSRHEHLQLHQFAFRRRFHRFVCVIAKMQRHRNKNVTVQLSIRTRSRQKMDWCVLATRRIAVFSSRSPSKESLESRNQLITTPAASWWSPFLYSTLFPTNRQN